MVLLRWPLESHLLREVFGVGIVSLACGGLLGDVPQLLSGLCCRSVGGGVLGWSLGGLGTTKTYAKWVHTSNVCIF